MYLKAAIAAADKLRPNTVEDEQKVKWLFSLEAEAADIMQAEIPDNAWPDDQELLLPEPVDDVYVYWLCAMIDWAQLDMQTYQIDQVMYDTALAHAKAWWRRKHPTRVDREGARL